MINNLLIAGLVILLILIPIIIVIINNYKKEGFTSSEETSLSNFKLTFNNISMGASNTPFYPPLSNINMINMTQDFKQVNNPIIISNDGYYFNNVNFVVRASSVSPIPTVSFSVLINNTFGAPSYNSYNYSVNTEVQSFSTSNILKLKKGDSILFYFNVNKDDSQTLYLMDLNLNIINI